MGLFSLGPKEKASYEVPGYLLSKEIGKLQKKMFTDSPLGEKAGWLLAFGAPMLGKDGQATDIFPRYQGKKYERMEKAFKDSWGQVNENTVSDQLAQMLNGSCTSLLDPIYHMTREYPLEQWDAQILRYGSFGERHSDRVKDMEKVYRRASAYGLALPEKTLFAYDLCRAANLVCIAVGLLALRPANAPYYLEQIAWAANRYYTSWEQYLSAFVVGRALWLWKMGQFLAVSATVDQNVCHVLLNAPQSACKRYDFSHALEACERPLSFYRPEGLLEEEDPRE